MRDENGHGPRLITSAILLAGLAADLCVVSAPALAGGNNKFSAPAKAAAPAGGGVHMPGGAAGGAHLPGGMASGGAHLPGGMAGGGAHIPGGMAAGGAHLPGSMAAGGAHVPGGMASGTHMAGGAHVPGAAEHASTAARMSPAHAMHPATAAAGAHAMHASMHGAGPEAAHAGAFHAAGAHTEAGGAFGRSAMHGDPRIGGGAAMHTAGLDARGHAGFADHHAAGFMNRPEHRDIEHERDFASMHAHDFHARYVHDFTPAEFARWHGGNWSVGWHYGRMGWWWDVDGVWYPYAEPIYPYPLEVAAITVYGDEEIDPAYRVADGGPAIPPLPAAPAGLFSCASPQGYYPAVQACGQPWQLVAANTP